MRLQFSLKDETLQAPDQGSNVCTILHYYAILFQRFTVTVNVIACILLTQMSQTLPSTSTPSTSTTPSSPVPNPACSKQVVEIPQLWRPSIMSAIQRKQLTSDVRNEISRDLITLLYTYECSPVASHCKKLAAQLVSKYPFMADTGLNKSVSYFSNAVLIYFHLNFHHTCLNITVYTVLLYLQWSWEQKLIDRLYNVERKRVRAAEGENEDAPVKKRGRPKKNESGLISRHPAVNLGETLDVVSLQNHTNAVTKEMQKPQPRKDIILSLMKFPSRSFILNHATSVLTTLKKYPALKLPYVV